MLLIIKLDHANIREDKSKEEQTHIEHTPADNDGDADEDGTQSLSKAESIR
jgi:hypothetical protein